MKQSGMFNAEWYARSEPPETSIGHYLLQGAHEGRDPHPLFSSRFYLEQNPDVAASGINPLVHYLSCGASEERDPHPLFSARYYLSKNPDVAGAGFNPLIHYLSYGAAQGRDPHPWFNGSFYRSRTPEAASPAINPLWHYLSCGALSVGDPHPCFSNRFYYDRNPDVAASGINPLVHYLTVGMREGRIPCPKNGSHRTMEESYGAWGIDGRRWDESAASASNRYRQVLVIDDHAIQASPSESRRLTTAIMGNLHSLGFGVGFLPSSMAVDSVYSEKLAALGTTVVDATLRCASANDYIACHGCDFGVFYVRNVGAPLELINSIRAAAPGARIVLHPSAHPELSIAARADLVVASSRSDAALLRPSLPDVQVSVFAESADASDNDVHTEPDRLSLISVLIEGKLLPLEAWGNYCEAIAPSPLPVIGPAVTVDVSIIIPVFNEWLATKRCLNAIRQTAERDIVFEIILADDGSDDETTDAGRQFPGIRIVRSERSTGFAAACNNAAKQARGRYLLFLDNRSTALPGWLGNLVSTADRDDQAGIVGSKLLRPDGSIESGGSTIFRDGTILDIGRGADRHVLVMNAEREADCASSASMLVRRSFWEKAGGFDGRYSDIGYMDADLGMAARWSGFRVIYQPASEIVLFGRSSGRSSLFVDKWRKPLLEDHSLQVSWPLAMSGAERSRLASTKRPRKPGTCNVLYFSPIPSHPTNHGNRANVCQFARWMQQAGHRVHFVLLQSGDYSADDEREMAANWDTFDVLAFAKPPLPSGADVPFDGAYEEGLGERIRSLCFEYDIDAVVCTYIFQSRLLDFVPAYCLKVIDTHDKMGHRYEMLRANGLPLEFFSCTPEEEGAYLKRADIVLARREEEAQYFDQVSGRHSAIVVPHFEPARFVARSWKDAKHIGMIASANNINLKMVHECIAAIDERLGGRACPFVLHVVGEVNKIVDRLPEDRGQLFGRPWVDMAGFVEDVGEFYEGMDLILSPVTVGTGINVKTVQAMAFGVPLLTTKCGSKGIESGEPRHSHEGMADLVDSLFEIVEKPSELARLAEVSRSTYSKFHQDADRNMRSIFQHRKLHAVLEGKHECSR